MEQEEDYQPFLSQYLGDQKIYRAYYLTFQQYDTIPNTLRLLMKTDFFKYYTTQLVIRMITNLLDLASTQKIVQDDLLKEAKQYADKLSRQYQSQIAQKESDILKNKNTQNKQSLRTSYIQMAQLMLKVGGVYDAYSNFKRAQENNPTQNNSDFAIDWLFTMLWEKKDFHQRIVYFPHPSHESGKSQSQMYIKGKEKLQYDQFRIISAIRLFQQMKFKECLELLQSIDFYLINDEDLSFTSIKDIGDYMTLSLLITQDKQNLLRIINLDNVRLLLDSNVEALDIISTLRKQNLQSLLTKTSALIDAHKYDSHINHTIQELKIMLKEHQIISYLKMYKCVKISSLNTMLELENSQTINLIEKIIIKNDLNLLIDPIQGELVQKFSQKEIEQKIYVEMTKKVIGQVYKNYGKMLQSQIVQQ